MPHAYESFLTRPLLRQLAGQEFFASGEECFALGRVQQIRTKNDRVSARVAGSCIYRVKLWRQRDELFFCCDCQAGREETFCQHCVAVGLAWLARAEHREISPATPAESAGTRDARREKERRRLVVHLDTLDKDRLTSLLLEATDYDEILRRRLFLEAIGISRPAGRRRQPSRTARPPDVTAYRQLLREAIHPAGFVDFHAMPDYAQGIEEMIQPLGGLLKDGWNNEVIDLTEFILWELDAVSDQVDTGDALFNKVYDHLQRYHLDACRAAVPDATALAARLLQYEIEGGLGVFNNAAKTYAEILGPEGLAEWRTLLLQAWKAMAQADGKTDPPLLIDHRRFQVQALMERMAGSEADLETQFAIRNADIAGVHDIVALAEWLQSNGQSQAAVVCAEQALRRYTTARDQSVLGEFLLLAYQSVGRNGAALPLAWEQFCASRDVEKFRTLKHVVLHHLPADWPSWRDKALAHVRHMADQLPRDREAMSHYPGGDYSRLVELLLDEDMVDAAWDAAAAGGCRDDLWLILARCREATQPGDSLSIYQRKISTLLDAGGRSAYREVLDLLHSVRGLLVRGQRHAEYERYLATLRSAHRRKRGFLRLLDTEESKTP